MNYILLIFLVLAAAMLIANGPEDDQAEKADDEAVLQAHRFFAADFFNKCWDLIDKPDRTPGEDLQMIHRAHASRAHWQAVGTVENFAVGEWQISHVYAILSRGKAALIHAQACLDICKENHIEGFNLGFAYEALARAEFVLGNVSRTDEYIALGKAEADKVDKEEDRDYLLAELNNIKK
jgi:hypothetical protein